MVTKLFRGENIKLQQKEFCKHLFKRKANIF
jgi:hypothetical protein